MTQKEKSGEMRMTYYPRSLEAGMRLIRHARSKHGSRVECSLRANAAEVIVQIKVK